MIMKNWLRIALTLSVLANIYFVYRGVDTGVTITYMSDEIRHKQDQSADVEKLLPLLVPNLTKPELLAVASKAGLEVIEKQEEGTYVGDLQFSFSGDKVIAVILR